MTRTMLRNPGLSAALVLAAVVAPAFAQEHSEPTTRNYFSQFFATDSMLGTIVIWSLVLNSVALMSVIIQALLKNRRGLYTPPALVNEIEGLIAEKKFRQAVEAASSDPSPFGQSMSWALNQAGRGYEAMEEALYEKADGIAADRVRSLIWMEIAGAAGPMLGLFGTVYGMIMAFTQMVAAGGAPKPAELAGGIATALVCTFWGLVVGIPGVISAAAFRVRIERLASQSIDEGVRLLSAFRPGAAKPASGAAPPPSGERSGTRSKPTPQPA